MCRKTSSGMSPGQGKAPHPVASLPSDLTDHSSPFHPCQLALDGCAAGTGQDCGHWGRHKWPFRQYLAQRCRRLARERRHLGFCFLRPGLDLIEMPHCRSAGHLHSLEPARQAFSRRPARAQPPCPTHGNRREDRTLSLTGGDPRSGDRCFHLVPRPTKPC